MEEIGDNLLRELDKFMNEKIVNKEIPNLYVLLFDPIQIDAFAHEFFDKNKGLYSDLSWLKISLELRKTLSIASNVEEMNTIK